MEKGGEEETSGKMNGKLLEGKRDVCSPIAPKDWARDESKGKQIALAPTQFDAECRRES